MPIINQQKDIALPEPLIRSGGVVVLPLPEYEKLKEDLEILQSKKLLSEIAKARKEAKQGGLLSLREVKKKLGL